MTVFAYSYITDGFRGTLYAGNRRLPLPLLPESPRLQQRVAFAMLLHAFEATGDGEKIAVVCAAGQ
jgi:hypothetical protein